MNIYLEVYGCTANKGDACLILGLLKDNNFNIVKNINDANTLILVTCTVIGTTEQRMLSRIREFKETGKNVIIAGCMASVQAELVKSIIPDVELLSPKYSHHIVDLLNDKNLPFEKKNKTIVSKYFDGITAPISIAEGCMFSCSYCITSLARGELVSYPINEIIKDIRSAIKQGCKDIQLTAQDTGSYGLDIGHNLGELLLNVSKIKAGFRIRVGMMNPYTLLNNIDSIIQGYEDVKIYKFLHLPIQSGDDEILQKMSRKYTVNDCFSIIKKFRVKYPDITIATDIIVGFPSEDEKQFQHTKDLLGKIKPDIINITRFSARPNTKAKSMEGRIKTEIVKERSKKLTDLCNKISKENNIRHIGKKYNILITEYGKNNTFVGRSDNYKPIVVKDKVKIGDFSSVKIVNATSTHLFGSLI